MTDKALTDKERLIELMKEASLICHNRDCIDECEYPMEDGDCLKYLTADHLIANDVVVQEQGKWILKETLIKSLYVKNAYCSECLEETSYKWNYCPNCGAKMVKEDK